MVFLLLLAALLLQAPLCWGVTTLGGVTTGASITEIPSVGGLSAVVSIPAVVGVPVVCFPLLLASCLLRKQTILNCRTPSKELINFFAIGLSNVRPANWRNYRIPGDRNGASNYRTL
jgi:hypothetical protein